MPLNDHWTGWVTAHRWRVWLWLGHSSNALHALDVWLLSICDAPSAPDVQCANSGLRAGLTDAAVFSLSGRPQLAHALATRSHLLATLGQWESARKQLEALVGQQPQNASAAIWFNLGYVHEQLAQPAKARLAFEQALLLSPTMDAAWLGLGKALNLLGRCDEAVAAWSRQVELQPLCPDGLECLVRLHAAQGQRTLAAKRLDQLRSFAPRQAMALESLLSV